MERPPFEEMTILPPTAEQMLEDPELLTAAREIYARRRARDRVMPPGLMGEPAWDILLALYAEAAGNLTMSSLCHGVGVPYTTASRWVGHLEARGWVDRFDHPRDSRVVLLALSDDGRLIVARALSAMLRPRRR